jgi:anti-sigma factor RsiW
MLGHPSKPELLAYAEGLVDGRGISAATARHITSCPVCAREVAAIRESIAFAASANALDPSEDSVSRILIAARSERKATRRARGGTPALVAKGLAYAAGVALVSAVVFQAGLTPSGVNGVSRSASAVRTISSNVSAEDVQRTNAQIETFAAAVGSRTDARPNYRTWQQAREVLAIDAALTAARTELQLNPASERANRVINSNLKRQATALKSLYVERSL